MMHRIFIFSILMLCPTLLGASGATSAKGFDTPTFKFGIVPQQSASKLARIWVPLCQYLSKRTGLKIEYSTAPTISDFEQRLSQGVYDFAYMNSYDFVQFNSVPGYQPIGHAKNKKIVGIIVVPNHSKIKYIEDLESKTVAFPSPRAFAASMIPRAILKSEKINIHARYVNSHDSVYRVVAKGIMEAGGGVMRTFKMLDPKVKSKLKILWKSEGFTPHAFTYHTRVPPKVYRRVIQELLTLNSTQRGQKLLKNLNISELVQATPHSWNDIRELNLSHLNLRIARKVGK